MLVSTRISIRKCYDVEALGECQISGPEIEQDGFDKVLDASQ